MCLHIGTPSEQDVITPSASVTKAFAPDEREIKLSITPISQPFSELSSYITEARCAADSALSIIFSRYSLIR